MEVTLKVLEDLALKTIAIINGFKAAETIVLFPKPM